VTDSRGAVDAMRTSVIGSLTGRSMVVIERGPVRRFAEAITDFDHVYADAQSAHDEGLPAIPVPPTYTFSALGYWGASPGQHTSAEDRESAPEIVSVLEELLSRGGVALHAEEQLRFERPLMVGDELYRSGRIVDRFEKERNEVRLTFVVVENEFRDKHGRVVCTARTTLVHKL
jgi:acyl dehydratase